MDRADQQMIEQEQREHELDAALDECQSRGVSKEAMLTLVFETGSRWVPKGDKRAA